MERIEKIAKQGYTLTQVAEVAFEERVYASKVFTSTPEAWKEVPISEFEAWQKDMDKFNPVISE